MFNLFKKNKQKTELEIAADNVLKAIDETQAAIEKRNAVFADVRAEMQKNLDKVIDFCESLKIEMSQDAVALELNGEMFFI